MTPAPLSPQIPRSFPRQFVLAILILAAVVSGFLALDYRNTERELRGLLESNAITLAESIAQTARFSLQSSNILQRETSRHLLAAARLIAHLDEEKRLTPYLLRQTAADLKLFRVLVLDARGQMILSNDTPASGNPEAPKLPFDVLQPLLAGKVSEIIIGLRESPFGAGSRFAVAVSRRAGGAVLVNIEGRMLEQYRKQAGLGQAVARMAANPSIAYLIIQDDEGPISVSPGVKTISSIEGDAELKKAFLENRKIVRFITLSGKEISETILPFEVNEDYKALFRVGMDLTFYHSQLDALKRRELILGGALLIGVGMLLGFVHVRQNYRYLHSRHIQALAMAGHITENMMEGLIVVDAEGIVIRFNRKAGGSFELSENSPLPARLAAALKSGERPCDAASPCYIQWEGKTFLFQRQELPEGEGNPRLDRLTLLLLRDVTEQRAMEQRLAREKQLAALGRLVSAVTHEIRNPLNALSLSVQTLQRRLKSSEDDRNKATLGVIREEIQRLNALVEDFLALSRPPVMERRPVAVEPLLARVRQLFAEELAGRKIRLEWAMSPPVIVSADENNLYRVMVNLVKNSLEVMNNGGAIRFSVRTENNHVLLDVHDTGPGFTAEALARGFEPFFSTRETGTGLGLSLCAEILRGHGWELRLGNHPDGGALVTIVIPHEDIQYPAGVNQDTQRSE